MNCEEQYYDPFRSFDLSLASLAAIHSASSPGPTDGSTHEPQDGGSQDKLALNDHVGSLGLGGPGPDQTTASASASLSSSLLPRPPPLRVARSIPGTRPGSPGTPPTHGPFTGPQSASRSLQTPPLVGHGVGGPGFGARYVSNSLDFSRGNPSSNLMARPAAPSPTPTGCSDLYGGYGSPAPTAPTSGYTTPFAPSARSSMDVCTSPHHPHPYMGPHHHQDHQIPAPSPLPSGGIPGGMGVYGCGSPQMQPQVPKLGPYSSQYSHGQLYGRPVMAPAPAPAPTAAASASFRSAFVGQQPRHHGEALLPVLCGGIPEGGYGEGWSEGLPEPTVTSRWGRYTAPAPLPPSSLYGLPGASYAHSSLYHPLPPQGPTGPLNQGPYRQVNHLYGPQPHSLPPSPSIPGGPAAVPGLSGAAGVAPASLPGLGLPSRPPGDQVDVVSQGLGKRDLKVHESLKRVAKADIDSFLENF